MKYIALDIGNVLCSVTTTEFVDLLSTTFNITLMEAALFFKRFQQIHDLGYTTIEDELKERFNVKSEITLDKIVKVWNNSIIPNMDMLNKLNELRAKHGLQVALLSNIGIEHAAMMEQKLEHGGFFPGAVKHLSCFVGARKPSMIFYQSFLLQHPEFKGCLYVDDLMANLKASEQFGFKTFHMSLELGDIDKKLTEIEELIARQENV